MKNEIYKRGKDADNMRLVIDELIKEKGIKHGFIADKLNVSNRTLYKWRKGETMPRLDKAVKLAKILNVEITELYIEE